MKAPKFSSLTSQGEPSIKTPTKKQKKGELTPEQKSKNKEMASARIFVEHLIRVLKIFRVARKDLD